MNRHPTPIKLNDIGDKIVQHLGHRDNINCYIGSNAATPTASLEALTDFIDPLHYYGGVGGQPDFVRALSHKRYGTPVIAMKSTTHKGASKIVPACPSGRHPVPGKSSGLTPIEKTGLIFPVHSCKYIS